MKTLSWQPEFQTKKFELSQYAKKEGINEDKLVESIIKKEILTHICWVYGIETCVRSVHSSLTSVVLVVQVYMSLSICCHSDKASELSTHNNFRLIVRASRILLS